MNDPEIWPSIEGVALALREAARERDPELDDGVLYVTRDVARRDRRDAEQLVFLGHLYVGVGP